ncbi:MAG TPA: response regulator [Mesorhizobium sp.]|jgi:DNA-binding LytR/AlgR family response regulator|uniref:response regulator n=1 Tax=Mesorhizobium sp. TaxID=1871066 RepID=UPI002DDD47E0|nr:response regulator [Mesorhizobium sp.]HEV2503744.1 response regulator [Mesorhizobium sp.]
MRSLAGANILIVEDEFVVANEIAGYFAELGAEILGPVATVEQARPLAERADAAVLDINLRGVPVFPIADRLAERGVPIVFFSAYDRNVIPPRLGHIASLVKPADRRQIIEQLFPSPCRETEESTDIEALLPKLRLAARLILPEPNAADRLVELTLSAAIREMDDRPPELSVREWLNALLQRNARKARDLLQ